MALFPNKPDDAINAGIEMQKEIILYNKNRTEKGLTPISIGIGIHTGNLMLGIIGETERMEGTVISDTVNLASRLEGLTKLYGITIMISEDTLLKVENIEIYKYRLLDNVVVKGKQNSIRVYQIFEGMSEREEELLQATKLSFELGIEAYLGRRFTEALELFQNVANVYPEDVPTQIYLKRCNKSITEGVSDDWTGIERMTEK
ncbi:MAG TPA: adenylate/guanylate cyclase domain-containing protein, partial [Leptospiraceae bacterium]|nr:adenylate/guanylate cyclase domain-containing protein [Leptospiraceae bacterium]